jgi:hypothetical protein
VLYHAEHIPLVMNLKERQHIIINSLGDVYWRIYS